MPHFLKILDSQVTNTKKGLIYLVLAVFFIALCFQAFDVSEPNRFNSWLVGDWLINYGGGFIRRGMSGHAIVSLSSLLKIRPELIVFILKSIFYAIIYLGLIYLIFKKNLTALDCLILLSPLTYSFPILEPAGGGRKEIILLAGMTILAIRSINNFQIPKIWAISISLLVLTSIHEGLLFFYPLALLLIPAMFGEKKYTPKELGILLLPSIILMTSFSLGGPEISQERVMAITKAIDPLNFESWNKGAIEALRWSIGDSINLVKRNFTDASLPTLGIAMIAFTGMFYLVGAWKNLCSQLSISPAYLIAPFLIQLPLLLVTIDWGRWLYIDASLLLIYYLTSLKNQTKIAKSLAPGMNIFHALALNVKGCVSFIVLLGISITIWKVKYCCVQGVSWGVLTRPFFKLLQI